MVNNVKKTSKYLKTGMSELLHLYKNTKINYNHCFNLMFKYTH